ncbi:hypothetical protein [Nitrospina watsonii]|uniref:hypothetical protein n=1 Tax=Nitrospina watsonii TaxID=1323948 RepID=UPI002493A19C|nr:hypothetical protein [Nitrospina watsonii]
MKKFVLVFAIVGFLLAIVFSLFHFAALNSAPLGGFGFILYIFFFPASMGSIGASSEDSIVFLILFSAFLNSIYYSILGSLLWYGLNKSRPVFFVSITAFIIAWGAIIIAFI